MGEGKCSVVLWLGLSEPARTLDANFTSASPSPLHTPSSDRVGRSCVFISLAAGKLVSAEIPADQAPATSFSWGQTLFIVQGVLAYFKTVFFLSSTECVQGLFSDGHWETLVELQEMNSQKCGSRPQTGPPWSFQYSDLSMLSLQQSNSSPVHYSSGFPTLPVAPSETVACGFRLQ